MAKKGVTLPQADPADPTTYGKGGRQRLDRERNIAEHGDDVVRMYTAEGMTLSEIGRVIGFSASTIGNWLEALGVEIELSRRPRPKATAAELEAAGDLLGNAVQGFPGYRVSPSGNVYGCLRGAWKPRRLFRERGRGRKFVSLVRPEGSKRFRLSRLILLAFCGPCPDGMECCHDNGDERDDRLDNLRWDTRLANCDDKQRHGTQPRGEKGGNAKLREPEVAEIKRRLVAGDLQTTIAVDFEISRGVISTIARGMTWVHVPWPVGPEGAWPRAANSRKTQRQQSADRAATLADTSRPIACFNGHQMTEDNLYVDPKGRAHCRECAREGARRCAATRPARVVSARRHPLLARDDRSPS